MDNIKNDPLKFGYHQLNSGIGYYINKVSQEVMDELSDPINKLKSNFTQGVNYNKGLAGEIEHEYLIDLTPKFGEHVKNTYMEIENHSNYMAKTYNPNSVGGGNSIANIKVGTEQLWVNFQQKYEYNPPHVHNGIYSFVLWYQVPYENSNEKKYSHKDNKSQNTYHGNFFFNYPDFHGSNLVVKDVKLNVDKSKEGYFVIFPSYVYHQVFPFYSSDDYRITVAGNINFI